MIITRKKDKFPSLDLLLLMLIICMNINRYFLNTDSNTIYFVFYIVFILAGLLICYEDGCHIRIIRITAYAVPSVIAVSLLVAFSFIRAPEHGIDGITAAAKFLVSLIIALVASTFSQNKIKKLYTLIVVYNVVYCAVILYSPQKATQLMMQRGMNYLNITLTIGLLLSLSLCYVLLSFYSISSRKIFFISITVSAVALYTMTRFNSRGSILLPIISMGIILLMIAPNKPLRFLGAVLVVGGLVYFGFQIYVNNTSEYIHNRMLRLFRDTNSESRIDIWGNYIETIIDRKWWIVGGGTDASRLKLGYYPHNLYLQLIGEFGLIGLFAGVTVTVRIVRAIVYVHKFSRRSVRENFEILTIFYLTVSSVLYYWFTFMKSFSFYDACPLFVFCALLIKVESLMKQQEAMI